MTLIEETIREFGHSIGMEDLRLRDEGTLVLDMERLGSLAFDLVGERREDVAVSLSRRIEPPDDRACANILDLCHYRSPARWPVRAGLTGRGDLVYAVRMDTSEFTLPNLHQALDWLDGLHQQSEVFVRVA